MSETPEQADDRLVDVVAKAMLPETYRKDPYQARRCAKTHLSELRAAGVTITPPPLPEPTYTITFTEKQRDALVRYLNKGFQWNETAQGHTFWMVIRNTIDDAKPNPVAS